MIPFVNLAAQYKAYEGEISAAVAAVFESGNLVGGPEVQKLEKTLSRDTGVPFAVTCSSGTSALRLSLDALGIRPGDEVIVPDYTFVATAETVVAAGGVPRFADVGPDFLISPSSVEERISRRTVGIIAVDLFGQCADYESLEKISARHGLWLLEDAAQSFGASRNGKPAGSFGTMAATSFYPTKPFGAAGDGGAIFTRDSLAARKTREACNHGRGSSGYDSIGTNSRLDAVQAAILNVKRKHFEKELLQRRKNAELYRALFNRPGFLPPKVSPGNSSIFAQYAVCTKNREAFAQKLSRAGIPTRIYYERPLSAEPCFSRFPKTVLDAAENANAYSLSRESFCLPVDAYSDVLEIVRRIQPLLGE